jgi:parvulin-like peptidyl-prolyl isomerase
MLREPRGPSVLTDYDPGPRAGPLSQFSHNRRKENALKKTILCIVVLSLLLSLGCAKREDRVVARVEDRVITIGQFEKASETMEEKYLPATNDLEGKKELLDHMINKEIMGLKAIAAGYQREPSFVKFWDRYKGQYLWAAMQNELVIKKVTVTDEEIEDYFDKMHNEYTISQIVVPEENQAQEIREKIMAGGDFEELAKKYSWAPEASSGGFLGPINVGAIHPWIEEALFTMKEGDISQALACSNGYTILKLHRMRRITPDKDKDYAARRVKAIKEKRLIEDLKKKIEKEVGLVIYPDAVEIVYSNLPPDIDVADIIERRVTHENAPRLEIPGQYLDMVIAQYSDSTYTLRDYVKIFNYLPLPERPRREQGRGAISESIHKRILDNVMPTYLEEKLKIQEVPEVAKGLAEKKEMFLVYSLYNDQVRKEVVVGEPDVREYYEEHKSEIGAPEERDFGIILVATEEKAKEIADMARQGMDWGALAVKYSEDPRVKESRGRVGFHARGTFVDYDDAVFSTGPGEVSEPFLTPRGWALVKVFEIKASELLPFEQAAASIRNKLAEEAADKLLMKKIETWRKDFAITIDEGNLKKAELKRTKPAEPPETAEQ